MPMKVSSLSVVQFGGDLYTIGGDLGGVGAQKQFNSAIHKLSCSSRDCKWATMTQELKVGRSGTVAIPISKSIYPSMGGRYDREDSRHDTRGKLEHDLSRSLRRIASMMGQL